MSCSGGACAREWAGDQAEIDYCEFICEQCDGNDPREFCIVDRITPDGTPTKVAVCCDAGTTCCGGFCCGRGDFRCCGGKCVNISVSVNHCGGCDQPCQGGRLCVDGDCRCPDGQIECNGVCVDGSDCPGGGCAEGLIPHPCSNLYPSDFCVSGDTTYVCCADFSCVGVEGDPAFYLCCGTADDATYSCKQPGQECRADTQYPNVGYYPR